MKPPRSILDAGFVYVPASHSNIRIRFAAERERIAAERREQQMRAFNVSPIHPRKEQK